MHVSDPGLNRRARAGEVRAALQRLETQPLGLASGDRAWRALVRARFFTSRSLHGHRSSASFSLSGLDLKGYKLFTGQTLTRPWCMDQDGVKNFSVHVTSLGFYL